LQDENNQMVSELAMKKR